VVVAREGLRFQAGVFQFRVEGLEFRVSGLGFQISGFGSRVSGFERKVSGFRIRTQGFGFQDSNARFRVSGFERIGLRCLPGCDRSTPARARVSPPPLFDPGTEPVFRRKRGQKNKVFMKKIKFPKEQI